MSRSTASLVRKGALAAFAALAGLAAEARAAFNTDLLATDLNNGRVFAFNPTTGAPDGSFGGSPNLAAPRGITIGPDGNVYVNDADNANVQEFSGTNGAFLRTFVAGGSGGLSLPYGMQFGPNGDLFIASAGTNNVLEYNGTTGAFVKVFASGNGLSVPSGMVFGPDGNLYVNSSTTNQVLEFNGTTGAFLRVFASNVSGPSGIAFGNGNAYVADGLTNSHTIYVLNGTTGALISTVNDTTNLNTPGGLVVGSDGSLLAASYSNSSLVRYNPDGSGGTVFATSAAGLSGPIELALAPVPEPSSLALLAIGGIGLAGVAARRTRRAAG